MRYLKSFESYDPTTKPAEPKTIPTTKPNRPSPIRRDRPSVEPAPKAKKKLATAEDVVQRYVDETKVSENSAYPQGDSTGIKEELVDMFGDMDWFETVKVEGQRDDTKYVIVTNRVLTDEELETIPEKIRGYSVVVDTK